MAADSPCLCTTLRRATRSLTASYDAALRPAGLRVTQFSILRILERLGPVTVTRLAAEAVLDRSTMGRNLDPLERRGLVHLAVNPADGRERVAGLTESGRAVLAEALPLWQAAQGRIEAALPPAVVADIAGRLAALDSPRAKEQPCRSSASISRRASRRNTGTGSATWSTRPCARP